jgi:ribA/ribD-fused uncharacterized protein
MNILGFTGENRWLSNFWPSEVEMDGVVFPSVENAYQAAKTDDKDKRREMATLTAAQAKKQGRKLTIRPDWETVKLSVMEGLLRQKFAVPELRQKLIDTGDAYLEETNWWGDQFWGVSHGKGLNWLGSLLMKIRKELANETARQKGAKKTKKQPQ